MEKFVLVGVKFKKTTIMRYINYLNRIEKILEFDKKVNLALINSNNQSFNKSFVIDNFRKKFILEVFDQNQYISESYYREFNSNILTESSNDLIYELERSIKFFKVSILHECNLISESQFRQALNLEEQFVDNLMNKAKQGVQAVGSAVQKAGAKVGQVVQKGVDKLKQTWTKIKDAGLNAFMEKYRTIISSGPAAAIQMLIEISTSGLGAIIPLIIWAILLLYDSANVVSGSPSWLNFIFSIIGTATTGIASAAIGKMLPLTKAAGAAVTTFDNAIAWIAKSKVGQMLEPFIGKIISGLSKIPGLLQKAITWINSVFGKIFGQGVVNFFSKGLKSVSGWVSKFQTLLQKYFPKGVAQTVKSGTSKGVAKALLKGGEFVPLLSNYLATSAGKTALNKLSINTVNVIKKQLEGKLKGMAEDKVIEYINNNYGKDYGNLLVSAKLVKDTKGTGKGVRQVAQGTAQGVQKVLGTGKKVVKAVTSEQNELTLLIRKIIKEEFRYGLQ